MQAEDADQRAARLADQRVRNRQRSQVNRSVCSLAALGEQADGTVSQHNIGRMDKVCTYCRATMWIGEKTGGSVSSPQFSMCCSKGQVDLPPVPNRTEREL